jgi:hypothetical protein
MINLRKKFFFFKRNLLFFYFHILCIILYNIVMKNLDFPTDFNKSSLSNFTKIRPVGAKLIHSDTQTAMTKLKVTFHDCANVPKNAVVSKTQ